MTKRILWGGLLGAGFMAIIVALWPRQMGENITVWRGWHGVARDDGVYLSKTLLRHHGNRIQSVTTLPSPADLAQAQVLVISAPQVTLSPSASARLATWVRAGGTLFAPLQRTLAQSFGLTFGALEHQKWQAQWSHAGQVFDLGTVTQCQTLSVAPPARLVAAVDNGAGCVLLARLQIGRGALVVWTGAFAKWWGDGQLPYQTPASEHDIPLLVGERGALLHNLIGDDKNILWWQQWQPKMHLPWRWLWAGWLALLLVLALGVRFGSRFGACHRRQPPAGGDLRRHWQAVGNLWAAVGEENALLAASQQRVLALLAPDERALDDVSTLAPRYGVAVTLWQRAFAAPSDDFVAQMAALETIRIAIMRKKE